MPVSIAIAPSTCTGSAEQIEEGADGLLKGMDAVVVPGGFGNRGVDGKIAAIRWACEQRVPFWAFAWACKQL